MRQEQGLGRIMTILFLVIILLAIGASMYFLQTQYHAETVETAKTEMLALQGKVKMVARENVMDKEGHPLLGELLEGQEETEWVKTLVQEGIIPATTGIYKVTQTELGILELNTITLEEGEYFLVNYEEAEVYFYAKQDKESYTWYQLSALLKTELEETENTIDENVVEEDITETTDTTQTEDTAEETTTEE